MIDFRSVIVRHRGGGALGDPRPANADRSSLRVLS